MPSNHLILCHPLLLQPSIFPRIRVFSNESALRIRWSKYWSFSFSISPSNEYSGLISFRMDCLDLLEVQGTLKSLLQHHHSKASILQCSAFFIVQLSHTQMATGKTIALTRWTFVGKVMSLLFNMLSRLVITFLPRSKCILISCSVNLWSNFLLMGGAVFPPCCLIWGQTMVEVMKIMSFKMSHARTAALSTRLWAGQHWPTPLPETPGHLWQVWATYFWVAAPFFWVLVYTRFCLCPPRVCFPSPM